ncbi:hypothetical protein M5J20_09050 [Corynebacterium sp. TA-R-1]|uniref:Integral membrane protein n=1 Tax=Corynebacterium stercoris TaxID=2943490 RepID=A0ABT1G2Y2_9CORY|nr:hypothetical protein [Corynebacterium stercoris]MCP1388331.1 hypothetical protein [Corynebacterium stercoris]
MTNPNQGGYPPYGEDPQPEQPNAPGAGNEAGGSSRYPSYPNYPSYGGDGYGAPAPGAPQPNYGDQPADYSQFEVNSAASMAGANALRYHGMQLTDGFYGDGTQPHPLNDPQANGWAHRKGTGKLRIGEAIAWAFKAYGKNPALWLIIGAITAVLSVLSSISSLPFIGGLAGIASLLLWPVFAAAALQQTLVVKLKSPSAPAYGKTLGVGAVIMVMATIAATILGIITFMFAFASIDIDPAALPQQPEEIFQDEALLGTLARSFGLAFGAIMLVVLLLVPFIVFPIYYAADNNGGFGTAFGQGMKAGARNYLPTLGLAIFGGLLNLVAGAPAFLTIAGVLGTVIGGLLSVVLMTLAAPIGLLMVAHAYRQVSGGPVPYDTAQ